MYIKSFPDIDTRRRLHGIIPKYMWPTDQPLWMQFVGLFTPEECAHISESFSERRSYQAPRCGAITKSIEPIDRVETPPVLTTLSETLQSINSYYFEYDIDKDPAFWLQTYSSDHPDYQRHMDYLPGCSRKLTGVVMLSEEDSYAGGDLVLNHPGSDDIFARRTQGSLIVFNPFVHHWVTPVLSGLRQTVNVGFYGPAWK